MPLFVEPGALLVALAVEVGIVVAETAVWLELEVEPVRLVLD